MNIINFRIFATLPQCAPHSQILDLPLNVKQVLTQNGVCTTGITGHSFPIGAATAAAQVGLEDSLIQTLGRWHSAAFLRYIRTPTHVLVTATTQLIYQTEAMQQHQRIAHQVQGGADP